MVDPRLNLSLFCFWSFWREIWMAWYDLGWHVWLVGSSFIFHPANGMMIVNRQRYCSGQIPCWSRFRPPLLPVTFPIFVASNSHFKWFKHPRFWVGFWWNSIVLQVKATTFPSLHIRYPHVCYFDWISWVISIPSYWYQKIPTSWEGLQNRPLAGPHHDSDSGKSWSSQGS